MWRKKANEICPVFIWNSSCKERQKASVINDAIVPYLGEYKINPQAMELFATILKAELKQNNTSSKKEIEVISYTVKKQEGFQGCKGS